MCCTFRLGNSVRCITNRLSVCLQGGVTVATVLFPQLLHSDGAVLPVYTCDYLVKFGGMNPSTAFTIGSLAQPAPLLIPCDTNIPQDSEQSPSDTQHRLLFNVSDPPEDEGGGVGVWVPAQPPRGLKKKSNPAAPPRNVFTNSRQQSIHEAPLLQ